MSEELKQEQSFVIDEKGYMGGIGKRTLLVRRSAVMPDGTPIAIRENGCILMAKPISKVNVYGYGAGFPKVGEPFDAEFRFPDADEAIRAFRLLKNGKATLHNYCRYLANRYQEECL